MKYIYRCIALILSLFLTFSINAKPKLTQASLNAVNNNFDELLPEVRSRIQSQLNEKLNRFSIEKKINYDSVLDKIDNELVKINDKLRGSIFIDNIAELDSKIKPYGCAVIFKPAINLHLSNLEFIENVHSILNPFDALDPANLLGGVIDAGGDILDPLDLIDNIDPLDLLDNIGLPSPGGILSGLFGGNNNNEASDLTVTGDKQDFINRANSDSDVDTRSHLLNIASFMEDGVIYRHFNSKEKGSYLIEYIGQAESDMASNIVCNQPADQIFRDGKIVSAMNRIRELLPDVSIRISRDNSRSIELVNFDTAPGFIYHNSEAMTVRIPRQGTWGINLPLSVQASVGYVTAPVPITVSLSNFKFSARLGMVGTDAGKFDITSVDGPNLDFDITVEDSNLASLGLSIPIDVEQIFAGLALGTYMAMMETMMLVPIAGDVAHPFLDKGKALGAAVAPVLPFWVESEKQAMIDDALAEYREQLADLRDMDLEPLGLARRPEVQSGVSNLETIVKNIDKKIIDHHLVHGVVMPLDLDNRADDSWLEAYQVNGSGMGGVLSTSSSCKYAEISFDHDIGEFTHPFLSTNAAFQYANDGAISTGLYLGSLAHRYKVLKDDQSLDYVQQTLRAVERLLEINNNSGLLARAVARKGSLLHNRIRCLNYENDAVLSREREIDGERWVGYQKDGVSRDMHVGVLFGLYTTYKFVDNEQIQTRARTAYRRIMDYLVGNKWIITEDRPATKMPQHWSVIPFQRIAYLTAAEEMWPGRYTDELVEARKLFDTLWFTAGFSSFDPVNKFYGSNLFYTSAYLFFLSEQDETRRAKYIEGMRVKDYYVGHHNNAYFNLIRAQYAEPSQFYVLLEDSRDLLISAMKGKHRDHVSNLETNGLKDLGSLETIAVTVPFQNSDELEISYIPKYPVDPALRRWENFLWQTSAFEPALKGEDEQFMRENIGHDITLVYWMIRHLEQRRAAELITIILPLLIY